jgi:hypothetical protein
VATYPYTSGPTALISTFAQLRNSPPGKIDAAYLQRNDIARSNESYVISILKFLGFVDDQGNRVENKTQFLYGNEETFKAGLEAAVREAYADVFGDLADGALNADRDVLMHWFRAADKTSHLVGQRQAATFQTLTAIAGHGALPTVRAATTAKKAPHSESIKKTAAKKTAAKKDPAQQPPEINDDGIGSGGNGVGLSVRIEVNLPQGESAETYDAIFASIKKHLMS